MLRIGSTTIAARTRGQTSFFAGSAPSARIASTCSVTFIAPTSAAMPLPIRPPTMTAVSVGASSRANERTTTRGMYSTPPKRRSPYANWMVMTIPMKNDVTATIPIDRTPSESIWCRIAIPSNGLRSAARKVCRVRITTSPRCSRRPRTRRLY